jgi:hypothetical protein
MEEQRINFYTFSKFTQPVWDMGPEMLFLLLKALISITAQFSPTRICFGPVLALFLLPFHYSPPCQRVLI